MTGDTMMWKVRILLVALGLFLAVGPVQAKKPEKPPGGGGGSDSATVRIVASGAIEADVQCEETLDANSTVVLCNKWPTGFTLTEALFDDIPAGCFGAGLTDGAIQLWVNKDNSAEAWFRFHAPDTTGSDVLYVLEVHAENWSGNFPPEVIDSPITMQGVGWLLRTSNKRQARDACLGSGFGVDDSITISLDRLPPLP